MLKKKKKSSKKKKKNVCVGVIFKNIFNELKLFFVFFNGLTKVAVSGQNVRWVQPPQQLRQPCWLPRKQWLELPPSQSEALLPPT